MSACYWAIVVSPLITCKRSVLESMPIVSTKAHCEIMRLMIPQAY